ncbi:MAG TPA: histidine kinase dimerization/phospho-acceptor domain-containing protein, partial [Phototrophicaceae bacterium]|nr:histidine kinase dimerization/phospho-acceptor domain-containing protein [Phototrophicaceae bacterium]
MDRLSVFQTLTLIANLLSLALAGGLAFSVLVQPRRRINTYLFVAFSVTMGLWALASILINTPPGWFDFSTLTRLNLRITVMGLLVLTYFLFVIAFIRPTGIAVQIAVVLAGLISLFALGMIWSGQMYHPITQDELTSGISPAFTTTGYFIMLAAVGYLVLSFWLLLSSPRPHARLLRIPTVLLILACASLLLTNGFFAGLDTFVITVAAVWTGRVVLRHQIFNPLNELNDELRIANRDLQQVASDLAAEKSRAEELNTELRAANADKSEFLSNMSHELRTPLNSIIGYSELLSQGIYGELNPKQADRLEKIHRNGTQLLEIISDILDLNKLDAGKLKLDIEDFDFAAMTHDVLDKYQNQAESKHLQVQITIPSDLGQIYGDPKRIFQVLDNLVDNAIKFTREGSVTIEARTVTITRGIVAASEPSGFNLPTIGWLRDGQWVIFNVTDTGIGIAPENQGRIFDEFAQVDG